MMTIGTEQTVLTFSKREAVQATAENKVKNRSKKRNTKQMNYS